MVGVSEGGLDGAEASGLRVLNAIFVPTAGIRLKVNIVATQKSDSGGELAVASIYTNLSSECQHSLARNAEVRCCKTEQTELKSLGQCVFTLMNVWALVSYADHYVGYQASVRTRLAAAIRAQSQVLQPHWPTSEMETCLSHHGDTSSVCISRHLSRAVISSFFALNARVQILLRYRVRLSCTKSVEMSCGRLTANSFSPAQHYTWPLFGINRNRNHTASHLLSVDN